MPSSNPDLLAHAKIYVFATRYLIDALREQSLKSLHRDLCTFQFASQNISRIIDLLEYTFENTARQEPGGCYSLRKLVIDYVAYHAKNFVKHSRFRQTLDKDEEIGSEIVAKLIDSGAFETLQSQGDRYARFRERR